MTAYTHFPTLLSTSKVKSSHIFHFNGCQSNLFEYLKTIDSRIVWWNNKSLLLTELSSVARCGLNRNPDRRNVERQNNKKNYRFFDHRPKSTKKLLEASIDKRTNGPKKSDAKFAILVFNQPKLLLPFKLDGKTSRFLTFQFKSSYPTYRIKVIIKCDF